MRDGIMSCEELLFKGFAKVGKDCQVSRLCSFYSISGALGDDVRIDDFCILKGSLVLDNHVHVCSYSMLSGVSGVIHLRDNVVLAARCTVYTGSNDHSCDASLGAGCKGVPMKYAKEIHGGVHIGIGTLVGAHCVILPRTYIGCGCGIGAGCIVSGVVPDGGMLRSPRSTLRDSRRDHVRIVAYAAELANAET